MPTTSNSTHQQQQAQQQPHRPLAAPLAQVVGQTAGARSRQITSRTPTNSGSGRAGNRRSASMSAASSAHMAPLCPLCSDLGWVRRDVGVGHPDFGKPVRCSCREAEDRARHAERAQAASNLRGRLLTKTFETFDCSRSASAAHACQKLRSFAEAPDAEKGWVALIGTRGTGKTHLLAAVANLLISRGESALYVVEPDFLDYLRAGYDAEKISESASRRMEDVRSCPVLLLDDVMAGQRTTWTDEQLYRLLNDRYNEGLPTVVASNVTLDKLEPRIASRLQDASLSQIVLLAGDDQRLVAHGANGAGGAKR